MSVNFGLLRPTDIGAQISAGAQDVKNAMLQREQQAQAREMQRQQIEGLAEQRRASAADRQSMIEQRQQAAAASQQRQQWLSGFASKLAEGGHKLDRPTMSQMIASPIPEIQQLGLKGLQELDAEEKFRAAMGGGAPGGAFDPQAVQGQINALLALRDPRAQAAAGQLQRQVEAEERRLNNIRDDTRAASRDAQMAADREEARRLRLTLAAGRGGGDGPNEVRFQSTDRDGNLTFYNKFGQPVGVVEGAGKPTAATEKATGMRKQLITDLDNIQSELTRATQKGGLLDQATGSGVGRLVDTGANFLGVATPGAIATGRLQPIADMVLKIVPRFEGPQSDKDTASYKQAAGELANDSLPNEIRKQAALEILRLTRTRKDQFVNVDMARENIPPRELRPPSNPRPPAARPPAPAAPPLPDGFREVK